ncbi:MAG: hypothetical protein CMM73_03590 [Rhodospirillaceae bacterium]|nr:hypothetical protein [Rhodospirillaceae bacterium]
MPRNIIQICLVASAILISAPVVAGSLENLERERSIMVSRLLDADLNIAQRQEKIAFSKRRLADLERIALNDKALKESRSPLVMKVFKNYEMSFLVHSAAESRRSMSTHWLEGIGLSTSDLMNTRSIR